MGHFRSIGPQWAFGNTKLSLGQGTSLHPKFFCLVWFGCTVSVVLAFSVAEHGLQSTQAR